MTPFRLRDRLRARLGRGGAGAELPVAAASAAPPAASPAPPVAASAPPAASAAPPPPVDADAAAQDAERQARHWARTRAGMLRWLAAREEGAAPLADMHAHSEAKYFVAHRAFSRLIEEFTGEGLVDYVDGVARLTDAGRAAAG